MTNKVKLALYLGAITKVYWPPEWVWKHAQSPGIRAVPYTSSEGIHDPFTDPELEKVLYDYVQLNLPAFKKIEFVPGKFAEALLKEFDSANT